MIAVRIAVVDDYVLVREALLLALGMDARFEIVAGSSTEDVLTAGLPQNTDIAIINVRPLDAHARDICGLLRAHTKARVLLTFHEPTSVTRSQIEALGANGAVSALAPLQELVRAILALANDEIYVGGLLAARGGRQPLSPRQEDVVRLVADGYTHREIAARLGIGVKSVQTYRARVADRLGVKTRVDFVRYARQQRWMA